jgi:hypothetical protein
MAAAGSGIDYGFGYISSHTSRKKNEEVKMIGAIAGDMIGSPYESYPIKFHCAF